MIMLMMLMKENTEHKKIHMENKLVILTINMEIKMMMLMKENTEHKQIHMEKKKNLSKMHKKKI